MRRDTGRRTSTGGRATGAAPGRAPANGRVWRNWGRNQSCVPAEVLRPRSEEELVSAVAAAAERGQSVRAVGAGHSYSAIACTDGVMLDLSDYGRVVAEDPDLGLVTVQAGMPLWRLNEELDRRGRALEVLGDINYQSVAGAMSTGTHGPGARFPCLAANVVACRLVTGDGTVVDCSPDGDAELLDHARVGLGALGLLSTVTLRTVPAFDLHTVEEAVPVEEVLSDLDALVDDNDHLGFFWFPGSRTTVVKRSNRTDAPRAPRPRLREWLDDVVVDNALFGAACRVATRVPAAGRAISAAAGTKGRHEWVDRSDRVFATPRLVRVLEMEYSIPREAFVEAFGRVGELVAAMGHPPTVPVECRWSAADDIPLSHAHGRDSAYIAVHMYRGVPYDQYFQGVEAIMDDYGGRPHWGKMHFQTARTLADRYPRWAEFAAVRARTDPGGVFANPYLDRVLGPVGRPT